MITTYKNSRNRRKARVRSKIKGTSECPRLSVFRSHTSIYAQLIDDVKGTTLVSSNDRKTDGSKDSKRTDKAREVGRLLAQLAKKQGITRIVFDRNGYKYHGRVKALADGAREEGLQF